MQSAATVYRFGIFQLDPHRRTLLAAGERVPLSGRAFDILVLLVAKRDRTVSSDEIRADVWKGLAVSDSNLTVQIHTLRTALKEWGGEGTLVLTVPGRGYQFVGEVAEGAHTGALQGVGPVTESAPCEGSDGIGPRIETALGMGRLADLAGRRKAALLAASGAAALVFAAAASLTWRAAPTAPRLSIAVLPLRNLSPDHAQDYLADALTDDLTTDLAHIPGATVIARESADAWKSRAASVQQIGRALGVRYIVEGSLRSEDNRLHVNAQLVDAATGAHLWADRFDAPHGHLADVQDAIVRRLATSLDFHLIQIESAKSLRDRPKNPDALDLFFRARAILDWDTSLPGLSRAQKLLEQAITQQPEFADALAELGCMLLTKVHDMDDPTPDHDYVEARDMIRRAIEVAPRNARALAAHGRALTLAGKWVEASYSAEAALAIEPSSVDAEQVLAKCAQAQGRLDDAVRHIEAILRLQPNSELNRPRYITLGLIHLVKGELLEGMAMLHQAITGDEDAVPTEGMGRIEVTRLLLIAGTDMIGKFAEANSMYNSYNKVWPNRTVWRFSALFDKSYTKMPGFNRIMQSLRHAGMPWVADEHVEASANIAQCTGTEFDETPTRLAGGNTLDTAMVVNQLKGTPLPIIVDFGRGVAQPPNAIMYDLSEVSETADDFALRVERGHDSRLQLITMGEGTYGCTAYLVALHLIAQGYRNVAWYRGGEESWAAAGQPYTDRRKE